MQIDTGRTDSSSKRLTSEQDSCLITLLERCHFKMKHVILNWLDKPQPYQ